MEFFGIEFAPLNIPFKRRMETLAVAAFFATLAIGVFVGPILTIYLLLYTSWTWVVTLYLIWMYTVDAKTSTTGARLSEWVRNWTWWKYLKHYFPMNLKRMPMVQLDPTKNYLFCCFPHGLLCIGPCIAFCSNAGGFRDLFPFHKSYMLTLKQHFRIPFHRELGISLGGCDASQRTINYLLGKPDGGNVVALAVGGASEALKSQPGKYQIVLKNRKGFVKLAIQNGSPLVPVISFGETDLYNQVDNPEGSLMRNIQEFFKRWIGMAPVVPIGRGFFQYTYGLLPKRRPLTTLVGRPIEVEKIESPTQDQIDDLHAKFVKELTKLFEDQKHNYIKNANNVQLEIE